MVFDRAEFPLLVALPLGLIVKNIECKNSGITLVLAHIIFVLIHIILVSVIMPLQCQILPEHFNVSLAFAATGLCNIHGTAKKPAFQA